MEDKKKRKKKAGKVTGPQVIYETEDSLYNSAVKAMNKDRLIVQHKYKIENYLDAARMFEELGEYKDASVLAKRCYDLVEQTKTEEKEYVYQLASDQVSQAKTIKDFDKAVKLFDSVKGYKDSDKMLDECAAIIRKIKWKNRIHVVMKLSVLLILIMAVVWFLQSPFWGELQQKMIEMNRLMSAEMPS